MTRLLSTIVLLLVATTAQAQDATTTRVKCGSTFNSDPKLIKIVEPGEFTLTGVPAWLLCEKTSGTAPTSIKCFCDKARLAPTADVSVPGAIIVAGRALPITYVADCSTQSKCGTGNPLPQPTARPTQPPAPTRTATPLPGQPTRTATALPSSLPTAIATGNPPQPTATRTALPSSQPTATRTAVPTAQPSEVPSSFVARPYRPTGLDVSFRVLDEGYPFRWCPLRSPAGETFQGYVPCTQVGMDAMTETSLVAVVNLVRVVRSITNGWANVADFMLSDSQGASAITAFLNPIYEGNFGDYRGDWAEDETGKDYRKPFYALKKARAFLLSNPVACAQAPEIGKFLDVLNLAIVGGQCVGTAWAPSYPSTKIPPNIQALGTIVYGITQPPLSWQQVFLLHETHRRHKEVSDWRCGAGGEPAPGVVQAAHLALEASARNEAELHRLTLKAFSGDVDPRYSRGAGSEECKWARLQDRYHEAWMAAVEAGDWAASRKAETNHQVSHLCMNLRDDRLLVRRTDCGSANVSDCPIETCAQILARLP